jgi:hypothetical protein
MLLLVWLFVLLLDELVTAVLSNVEHGFEIHCTLPLCPLCLRYLHGGVTFGFTLLIR